MKNIHNQTIVLSLMLFLTIKTSSIQAYSDQSETAPTIVELSPGDLYTFSIFNPENLKDPIFIHEQNWHYTHTIDCKRAKSNLESDVDTCTVHLKDKNSHSAVFAIFYNNPEEKKILFHVKIVPNLP